MHAWQLGAVPPLLVGWGWKSGGGVVNSSPLGSVICFVFFPAFPSEVTGMQSVFLLPLKSRFSSGGC